MAGDLARALQLQQLPLQPGAPQPANNDSQWFSVVNNFEGEFTVSGLLRILQQVLHEVLQQSFTLPTRLFCQGLHFTNSGYISEAQK